MPLAFPLFCFRKLPSVLVKICLILPHCLLIKSSYWTSFSRCIFHIHFLTNPEAVHQQDSQCFSLNSGKTNIHSSKAPWAVSSVSSSPSSELKFLLFSLSLSLWPLPISRASWYYADSGREGPGSSPSPAVLSNFACLAARASTALSTKRHFLFHFTLPCLFSAIAKGSYSSPDIGKIK